MSAQPEVPRDFRFIDHFALWATLSAGLYILPFGAFLTPALSIGEALFATLVAAFVSALLIAAIAAAAARSGASTLELVSAPFGRLARTPFALLLLVRNVLFAAFSLSLIAGSAELVSERALGTGLRPVWVVLFGLAAGILIKAGPSFVVTRLLRRGGVWLILLVAVVIAGSAYMEFEIPSFLRRPAVGGWPEFWQAVDIMLIVPLLWLPVVADFARHGREARPAAGGAFLGVFAMTLWFGAIGVVYLPSVESGDIAGFVVGMNMSLGAIVLLFLLQADEVFASGTSASSALEALPLPDIKWPLPATLVTLAAVAIALTGDLLNDEGSFLLLGSVFVPLFGVVIADQMLTGTGRLPGLPLFAWASGFVAYHWISPSPAGWWLDVTEWLFDDTLGLPYPLADEVTWLGAAIPSFLLAFAIQVIGIRTAAILRLTTATDTRPA